MRALAVVGTVLLSLAVMTDAGAAPVVVRHAITPTTVETVMRSPAGETIASGQFVQRVGDDGRVDTTLALRFTDGSVYEEHVTFTQGAVLELQRYRVVQTGPSFPDWLDATVDRASERYHVRHRGEDDTKWSETTGRLTLPADVYNGMLPAVLRQLTGAEPHHAQIVAFTPRPRLVTVRATPAGEEPLVVRDRLVTTRRFQLKPQLGLFASLLIADIPPAYLWVGRDGETDLIRFQGPLYFMGPIWKIEER